MDPLMHIPMNPPQPIELDMSTFKMVHNVYAEVVDMQEKAIVEAIIKAARNRGIDDLYLIDEKFILEAIQEKMERERRN